MKPIVTPEEAVKEIKDGSSIMIGGFGGSGDMPTNLILALSNSKAKNLTIISNTGGLPGFGLIQNQPLPVNHDILIRNKQVSKIISSFPVSPSPSMKNALEEIYKEENIIIEYQKVIDNKSREQKIPDLWDGNTAKRIGDIVEAKIA